MMSLELVLALAMAAAGDKATLRGLVRAPSGSPLADAKVMIYTAHPRLGTSTFCPSCYLDCGRSATTGADGHFEISHVDPTLLFRIVVMAEKHQTLFQENVDPSAAELRLSLAPSPPMPRNPKRVLRGQVLGPTGPVPMTIVEPQGFTRREVGSEDQVLGELGSLVSPTITDSAGKFDMALQEEVDSLVLLVSPRGLTRRVYDRVPTGTTRRELTVSYGTAVRGRIVQSNRPLSGVAVNLEQRDRDAAHWVGTYSASTNDSGQFLIANVLPNEAMVAIGATEDLAGLGYVPTLELTTSEEGKVLDVGDLEVQPGSRVSGKVVLSDGRESPPHTRLTVSRDGVGDSQGVELAKDGSFDLLGVPREVVSLSVRVPGYRLSRRNASLVSRGTHLLGRVQGDVSLTVLLEPEDGRPPDSHVDQARLAELRKATQVLRQMPLAGVGGEQQK